MKCPYQTACENCGLQNHEICNTCPLLGQMMDCPSVNTSGMTMDIECDKCKYYNQGVRPTGAMPILGGVINSFKNYV